MNRKNIIINFLGIIVVACCVFFFYHLLNYIHRAQISGANIIIKHVIVAIALSLLVLLTVIAYQRKKSMNQLKLVNSELTTLYNAMPSGIFQYKNNRGWDVLLANDGFYKFLNYKREDFKRKFGDKFICIVHKADRKLLMNNIKEQLKTDNKYSCETRIVCKDDHIKWVWITGELIKNNKNEEFFNCTFLDITPLKKTQQKKIELIEECTKKDPLTQLYNKVATEEMINNYISEQNKPSCFIMIDIDNFKGINDTLGHIYGDYVISELSNNMHKLFRSDDILGRIGGDEFVVFLTDLHDKEVIDKKACELLKALEVSIDKDDALYRISGSIGISLYPENGNTYTQLLESADKALYEAKNNCKNQYVVYNNCDYTNVEKNSDGKRLSQLDLPNSKLRSYRQNLIENILNIFCEDNDITKAMPEILELIGNSLGAERTFLSEKNKNSNCYEKTYEWRKDTNMSNHSTEGFDCGSIVWDEIREKLDYGNVYFFENGIIPTILCYITENNIVRAILSIEYSDIKHVADKGEKGTASLISKTIAPFILRAYDKATADRKVNNEIVKKSAIEKILVNCISNLMSADSFEDSMIRVLKEIAAYYNGEYCFIFETNSDFTVGQITYVWSCNPLLDYKSDIGSIAVDKFPYLYDKFVKNEAVIINNISDLKDNYHLEYEMLRKYYARSLYAVPFKVQDKLVGYIGITNVSENVIETSLLNIISYFIVNEVYKHGMRKDLEFLCYHDPLTALPERNSFNKYIAYITDNEPNSIGVITGDIDGLREINKNYGHLKGDETVQKTAEILRTCFADYKVFRLSGDEFIVLCYNISKLQFAEKIREVKQEFSQTEDFSVSFGYTWANESVDIRKMLEHSEELLFINKKDYYEKNKVEGKHQYNTKLIKLINSIKNNEFVLYLQPLVDPNTKEAVSAEALIRHIHPQYGFTLPSRFIGALENDKLISYIDLFVFEEVCKTLTSWSSKGYRLIPISLNFSRETMLHENLMNNILSIYNKYNVPKEYINIEITETIGDIEREIISDIATKIKKLGFRIILDDFGSEYTSLSLLTIMIFDEIKIDKSVIDNLVNNKASQIIVESIVSMCQKLNAPITAEGVETIEQFDLLKNIGCNKMQGYLFSKPISVDDYMENLLKK